MPRQLSSYGVFHIDISIDIFPSGGIMKIVRSCSYLFNLNDLVALFFDGQQNTVTASSETIVSCLLLAVSCAVYIGSGGHIVPLLASEINGVSTLDFYSV